MSEAHSSVTGLTIEQTRWFWSLFEGHGPEDCWPWPRSCAWRGYGQVMFNNRKFLTHRLAWMLANEQDIPMKMHIAHSCDNPGCCNPRHLSLASAKENERQAWARGRKPRGEQNGLSKLNDAAVRFIRLLHAQGHSLRDLAKGFRVSHTTVVQVVERVTWKHVAD